MKFREEFPQNRREDPKRQAEWTVYLEITKSDRPGEALYELKTNRSTPELDYALFVEGVAHFALEVKGGRYTVRNGSWYLHTEHGEEAVSNPFKVAWDAGMQIREVIQRELHRKVYVVVVVVFSDMEEPDPGIEVWVANERVRVLWGSHDLVDRLVEMVSDEDIYSPPTGAQIEEEIAVLRPGLVAETKVGGAADDVPAPAPTTIDLTNRQPVIGHADVVNVYNGPVTIYQGSAPASDHQSPSMSDNG